MLTTSLNREATSGWSEHSLHLDNIRYTVTKAQDIRRRIWVTFQREGIHHYPAAATEHSLREVSYLANPHRHVFHFRVEIEVFHDDRDIEFILFKNWLTSLYAGGTLQLSHKSCEMISDDLAAKILERYPNRHLTISVAEDNENGSITEYNERK